MRETLDTFEKMLKKTIETAMVVVDTEEKKELGELLDEKENFVTEKEQLTEKIVELKKDKERLSQMTEMLLEGKKKAEDTLQRELKSVEPLRKEIGHLRQQISENLNSLKQIPLLKKDVTLWTVLSLFWESDVFFFSYWIGDCDVEFASTIMWLVNSVVPTWIHGQPRAAVHPTSSSAWTSDLWVRFKFLR